MLGVISSFLLSLDLGERQGASVLGLLGSILPLQWRPNSASNIAEALLEAAIEPIAGIHVVNSELMT